MRNVQLFVLTLFETLALCPQVQHLVESRELSRGMGNLIKFIRFSISKVPLEASEAEAKSMLLAKLQSFLEERIVDAAENIAKYVISTLRDNDVVLTFGSSPLVRKILLAAAEVRSFRLVVVDARPLYDGLQTLTALSPKIHCVVSVLLALIQLLPRVFHVSRSSSSGIIIPSDSTAH